MNNIMALMGRLVLSKQLTHLNITTLLHPKKKKKLKWHETMICGVFNE